MKASKLKSFCIILKSSWYTFVACSKAVTMRLMGKINRQWVDNILTLWINRLLDTARVSCVVHNPNQVQPPQGRATILMCNHTSLYDIPISYKAFPQHSIRMLAKREMASIPIIGKGMSAAEFPFIDRKNRSQALQDLAYARTLMESGIVIWIAPEGTRSADGKLRAFKKGAFITAIEAQAVIIPMVIRGAAAILPARTYRFNLDQTATICIGDPIDTLAYSLAERDQLIEQVHSVMHQLLEPSLN